MKPQNMLYLIVVLPVVFVGACGRGDQVGGQHAAGHTLTASTGTTAIVATSTSVLPVRLDIDGPSGLNTSGLGLNRTAQVLVKGWSDDSFLWTQSGGIVRIADVYHPVALNNGGQVAAITLFRSDPDGPGYFRAALWEQGVGTRDLGTLGGPHSYAYALNDSGQVAGESMLPDGSTHAFVWSNGKMMDLGTLGGTFSSAVAINESGQVVGHSTHADATVGIFSWTAEGGMIDLGLSQTGSYRGSLVVNDDGQVAGSWAAGIFKWSVDGGLIELSSEPRKVALNNSGAVAFSSTVDGYDHAFLWTPEDGTVDLGPGVVSDLSDSGQVVGWRGIAAFSWTRQGGMVDLGEVVFRRYEQLFVNDAGQVLGTRNRENPSAFSFCIASLWKTNPVAEMSLLSAAIREMELLNGTAVSLDTKISAARSAYSSGNRATACDSLTSFVSEASALSGKKLTIRQADYFKVAATDVRTMIGCQ